jgi:hypothetical protein
MKTIQKDELFEHLSGFLKSKGIELKQGSYAQGIQRGCSILADTINLGQQGLERAKSGIDKNVDKVRQVIHEKTAPKTAARSSASKDAPTGSPAAASSPPAPETSTVTPTAAAPKTADRKRSHSRAKR